MRLILLILLLPSLAAAGTLKGVGGIDEEPSAWTEFANVVSDPGFENGTNWTLGSGCSRSTEQAATGSYSLKCTGTFGMSYQPGVVIGYIGSGKTAKIYPGADATGSIVIETWNSTRSTIGGGFVVFADTGAVEWKGQINAPKETWTALSNPDPGYTAPGLKDDSLQVRIRRSTATGTWYFDDISFTPAVPLVRTFVTWPNFRGYLWSDWSQTVTGMVEANAPEGGVIADYKAVVKVYKVVDGGANTLEDTITILSFDASDLADGAKSFSFDASGYALNDELLFQTELQLKSDSSVAGTFSDWRVVLKDKTVRDGLQFYFDQDNKLVKDGQRRFVYGAYQRPSGIACQGCVWTDKNKYLNDWDGWGMTIGESHQDSNHNTSLYWSPFSGANPGFNSSTSDWSDPATYDVTIDSMNPWIETLDDYGASHFHITNHLFTGNSNRPSFFSALTDEQMWQVYASYPKSDGFFGWYLADEPDLYNSSSWTTENKGWSQYEVFREHDPYRPAYGVMYNAWTSVMWRDQLDVIASDPYPIGRNKRAGDHLYGDTTLPYYFQVNQWTDYLEETTYNARPHWEVLQLWRQAYNPDPTYNRYPTYEDLRLMAWKAIIGGADGILWWGWVSVSGLEYQYYYGGNTDAYDLEYKRISDEIMDIEATLVGTDVTDRVTCSNGDIDYLVLSDGASVYVMASNTLEAAQSGVEFSYVDQVGSSVEVYTEGRVVAALNGTFSDDFASYDVHVYTFDTVITETVFDQTGTMNFNQSGTTNFNQ